MKHLSIIIILILLCSCSFQLWYVLTQPISVLTPEQRARLPYLIEKLEYARNDHLWYAENPDRWYSHHRTVEWEFMWVDIYEETMKILEVLE